MRLLKSVIEAEDSETGKEVVGYWSDVAPINPDNGEPFSENTVVTLIIGDSRVEALYRGRSDVGFSGLHHYLLEVKPFADDAFVEAKVQASSEMSF